MISRIWKFLREWWTPDDEEDADGFPGDECPMCAGTGGVAMIANGETKLFPCFACKGKGKVE